jgi:hypothetical protein
LRYLGGVGFLVWFGGFWYTLGDHDALALCYLGGFTIGDDFAILEEFCYLLETLI